MTIEMTQKERLCTLPPDYAEQLIMDWKQILIEKLGRVGTELAASSYIYDQKVLEIKNALREEGLSEEDMDRMIRDSLPADTYLAA